MNVQKAYRQGNQALEYVIRNCQPLDSKVTSVIELIPKISDELYSQARQDGGLSCFTGATNRISQIIHSLGGSISGRNRLVTNCIFDLSLTVFFQEVCEYCGNKEIASLLTDALLYQATGNEASSVTEHQILEEGTHNARGIHKFAAAKTTLRHIGDTVAWVFGKEIAALQNSPGQIGIILSVAPISVMLRVHSKWTIRYFLYGKLPTEDEQRQLDQLVAKMQSDARRIFAQDTERR